MIDVPPLLRAPAPAEFRGLRRDHVRLMVVDRTARSVRHTRFDGIGALLTPGDLLVVNTSRTLPAAIRARREGGDDVELRPAVRRGRGWDALAVEPQAPHRNVALRGGEILHLDGGVQARVLGPRRDVALVWRLELDAGGLAALLAHGEHIRYSYVPGHVPAEYYQNVYAIEPGSAEAPSAGRPLTWELLTTLRQRGVAMAPIVLHAGLSSFQDDAVDGEHHVLEEWFSVGVATAEAANHRRGRLVAVGTTVVRALESASDSTGVVSPMTGWTELIVTAERGVRSVDALLTGMHEPSAGHIDIVRAMVRDDALVARALDEGTERGYLWHEFGDSMLIL